MVNMTKRKTKEQNIPLLLWGFYHKSCSLKATNLLLMVMTDKDSCGRPKPDKRQTYEKEVKRLRSQQFRIGTDLIELEDKIESWKKKARLS
jgi:hypothetical protein